MTPFNRLEGTAAALPVANVDTDSILAARYLKTINRSGLGCFLFAKLREDPEFILNRAPWSRSCILVALDNFGCGSSREHAPWALLDFGIRCIIAPSIADIFYNNCLKNGMLPIVLPIEQVEELMQLAADPESSRMCIDLEAQTVVSANGKFLFEIDSKQKRDLLLGLDEIANSLQRLGDIMEFEVQRRSKQPWSSRPSLVAYFSSKGSASAARRLPTRTRRE